MTVNTSVSLLVCARLTSAVATNASTVNVSVLIILNIHFILHCTIFFHGQLWFYDGSVQCFHEWHILLAIVALLFLLALAILVILVISALHFNVLYKKVCMCIIQLVFR